MGTNKNKKNKNKSKRNIKNTGEIPRDDVDQEVSAGHSEEEQPSLKRDLEDDSDSEAVAVPKKKKKKNQQPQTDTKKPGQKSIRQMKREKLAQRQAEVQAEAKDQLKAQCITYLSEWKHNRQNWKFMKAKQVWLYKNKFSSYLVPDSSWPTLLEYFESAKGNIRNMLLEDSRKIIKLMDDWKESQSNNETTETSEETNKPDDVSYKRARDLMQCLEE